MQGEIHPFIWIGLIIYTVIAAIIIIPIDIQRINNMVYGDDCVPKRSLGQYFGPPVPLSNRTIEGPEPGSNSEVK